MWKITAVLLRAGGNILAVYCRNLRRNTGSNAWKKFMVIYKTLMVQSRRRQGVTPMLLSQVCCCCCCSMLFCCCCCWCWSCSCRCCTCFRFHYRVRSCWCRSPLGFAKSVLKKVRMKWCKIAGDVCALQSCLHAFRIWCRRSVQLSSARFHIFFIVHSIEQSSAEQLLRLVSDNRVTGSSWNQRYTRT